MLEEQNKKKNISNDFEVRTMPKKFLIGISGGSKRKIFVGTKKTVFIGVGIVVVSGVLMLLAAQLFLRSVKKDNKTMIPDESINQNQNYTDNKKPEVEVKREEKVEDEIKPTSTNVAILDISSWNGFDSDYYSMKYPLEWELFEEDDDLSPTKLSLVVFEDTNKNKIIEISVFNNEDNYNLLDWVLENKKIDSHDLKNTTLAGNRAYKYKNLENNDYQLFSLYNNKIYSLVFSYYEDYDDAELDSIYNKIFIYFKLITSGNDFDENEIDKEYGYGEQPKFVLAKDTDKDLLTDIEEILYQTDKEKKDTDGDGYIDGEEIINLYDPNSIGDVKIYESSLFKTYQNIDYGYTLLRPLAWKVKGISDSMFFQSSTGEFVQILIQPNEDGYEDINSWYKVYINKNISGIESITIDGVDGIVTPDGMRVYILVDNDIYSFIYNIGLREDANFMTTFRMILKSFSF